MRVLGSVKLRIFLVAWVIYSLFFATNVVREHYPAFSLAEHGTLRCDEYLGWHSDIFQHTDGHSYINSNVLCSIVAAVPLFVFSPVLDALERHSKAKLAAAGGLVDTGYDTKYPARREMFRKVKLAGKDLRFGAATVVTSALLMAPLAAWTVVWLFGFLQGRGVPEPRAVWLALLYAFGTPLFYRAASLNHNLMMMVTSFGAFLLLYEPPGRVYAPSGARRFGAGLLCGATAALDYAGVVLAGVLFGYYLLARARFVYRGGHATSPPCRQSRQGPTPPRGSLRSLSAAGRDSLAVAAGGLPGVGVLLLTQWLEFGNPLTPAQFVMKSAAYTGQGVQGIGAPSLELYLKNLFAPGWGLYTFAPLLLLGLWRAKGRADSELVLPHRERWLAIALVVAFVTFCSMNFYSLMQFNTGFRYLIPLVPFMFLQAADPLSRMSRRTLGVITVAAVLHTAVLCMTREVNDTEKELRDAAIAAGVSEVELPGYWTRMLTETPIPVAYRRVFVDEGVQLPWLKVLGQTSGSALLKSAWPSTVLLLLTLGGCAGLWWWGERVRRGTPAANAP